MIDWTAYTGVATLRLVFDLLSGYKLQKKMDTLDERAVLSRCIFLETVAGVPGFAAGMMRHLQSLRKMERDHGWIHTLLEEAENERMHLMTFMQLRRPGLFFRFAVINTQIIFTLCFCLAYLLSPRLCHRSVLSSLHHNYNQTYPSGLLATWRSRQSSPTPTYSRRSTRESCPCGALCPHLR